MCPGWSEGAGMWGKGSVGGGSGGWSKEVTRRKTKPSHRAEGKLIRMNPKHFIREIIDFMFRQTYNFSFEHSTAQDGLSN